VHNEFPSPKRPFPKKRNRPPDEEEAGQLNPNLRLLLEMEPQTCANQVLSQIATLIGIDLGARIVEVVVFDEGAELGSRNTQPKRCKMDQWFARRFSS
jgi:hypothetical protein